MSKNNGIVRRPAEYALIVVATILVVFLLWSAWVINRENKNNDEVTTEATELTGSAEEVNQLTEDDLEEEQAVDTGFDASEESSASADGAADNIGGVYEEDNL